MAKKKTRISALNELLEGAQQSTWCIVDTENKFTFNTDSFIISKDVKQYIVLNKANGKHKDWTNEALMTQILCIDTGEEIRFFDENLSEINSELIKLG